MVLGPYNHSVYDSLGEVSIISKEVQKSDIDELGRIILRNAYEKSVSIIIAHRHFDLQPEEAMLEEANGLVRLSKPYPLKEIEDKGATPNILKCTSDGEWFPVGYELSVGQEMSWKDENFLKEVGDYLVKNRLADKLMLGRRFSGGEKLDESKFCEFNHFDTRTSENRLGTDEELTSAIPTTYAVKSNGDAKDDGFCIVCHNCIITKTGKHG
ncbi:hypothetical protein FO519_009083 [Halicephalobus sp. NKZ332]|nr:hypothetical protein FO519_009083 [Halicephalobus sp. NKZ332]